MRGCHDQLAYELLYARRRGSKCCFQSATRSRTERPEREPSPLPGSSGPLSSEAKPGGTRKRDAGDLPWEWKRPATESLRTVPLSRASIPCICSPAACRGARTRIPLPDGNLSGVSGRQGRMRGSRPPCWHKRKTSGRHGPRYPPSTLPPRRPYCTKPDCRGRPGGGYDEHALRTGYYRELC